MERPLGRVPHIIRCFCLWLCDKLIAQLGVGIKCRSVFPLRTGIQKTARVRYSLSGIGKAVMPYPAVEIAHSGRSRRSAAGYRQADTRSHRKNHRQRP